MTTPHDDDRRPLEDWEEADPPERITDDTPLTPAFLAALEAAPPGRVEPASAHARPPLTITPQDRPLVFDAEQEYAIELCGTELYTNISGTAGVGKTAVAKEIIKRHPGVVLAATTGIASVNLGEGTTINSLLKYFDTESLRDAYEHGPLQAQIRRLQRAGVRRILIDEKSMMQGEQLTMITRAVREVNEGGVYALEDVGVADDEAPEDSQQKKRKELPPIGITLCGDFGQLPPVPDKDPKTGKNKPVEFAFDSLEWPLYAEHTTTLTTIYRQDAQDFVAALHAVRKADVQAAVNFFTPDRFARSLDEEFDGTTIFAKNVSVDRHNMLRLDKVHGAPMVATARRCDKQRGDWKQIPDTLRLKEGALVMILANQRDYADEFDSLGTLRYANGDLGMLQQEDENGNWYVTLHRTGCGIVVEPVKRENTIPLEVGRRKEIREAFTAGRGPDPALIITDEGTGRFEIVGTITYMPLRAAYGCTVHKTQGLTLDHVQVNIRDWMFKVPGMLFVALSRARTAEGLRIVGDQRGFIERCRIEPRVQPWL